MQLVIAEKPSVGISIAAVLGATSRKDGYMEGGGYIVSWCFGHLVGLADAQDYDEKYGKWRYEDLPIIPENWQYTIFGDKRKQYNTLRALMHREDVESLICATDAGREGELIFRFVYQTAGCKKPFKRLWISSMEESAIKKGFSELRDGSGFDPLYDSALCRAKADWLIGINATRLFSALYNRTLNVGRVQTPTLAMITERQQKISCFTKEKYHIVRLGLGGFEAVSGHITDRKEAEKVQTACDKKQAVCSSIKKEQKTLPPPKLFDLTALQRECNRLFGYTAQQTLDAAQKLYESKLITYPRTDSRFLTSDMAVLVPALAQAAAASGGVTVNTAQVINDAKVSDHHAIIPTAGAAKAECSALPETERNTLALISARLVCAVGEKHVFESVTAVFGCGGYSFTAKGKTAISEGWKAAENRYLGPLKQAEGVESCGADAADGADPDAETSSTLPPVTEGQVFENASASVSEHYTQPPKPYTEDTLLAAMENAGSAETATEAERSGLGTPATRAAVIEKLVKGGFIARKGRQISPTPDGVNLIKLMPPALKSPALTSVWENALDLIAKGETEPGAFIRSIEAMARSLVSENASPVDEYIRLFAAPREPVGACPRCGGKVFESKKNYHCENRDCLFVMWKADRFFTSRKNELTKTTAAELLKTGRAKVKGLFSEKTGKAFDAVIHLADTGGKYVNYRFDKNNERGLQA